MTDAKTRTNASYESSKSLSISKTHPHGHIVRYFSKFLFCHFKRYDKKIDVDFKYYDDSVLEIFDKKYEIILFVFKSILASDMNLILL